MESAEVVVARIVPFVAAPPSRRSRSAFAPCSSAIASTTNVASRSTSRSLEIATLPAPTPPRFSISRSTLAVAASGRRAHSTTWPCSAATHASPEAMAPPPAIPIRSDTVSISLVDWSVNA